MQETKAAERTKNIKRLASTPILVASRGKIWSLGGRTDTKNTQLDGKIQITTKFVITHSRIPYLNFRTFSLFYNSRKIRNVSLSPTPIRSRRDYLGWVSLVGPLGWPSSRGKREDLASVHKLKVDLVVPDHSTKLGQTCPIETGRNKSANESSACHGTFNWNKLDFRN